MRIVYTSDLHVGAGANPWRTVDLVRERAIALEPDVFLVVGDVSHRLHDLGKTLARLHDVPGVKMFVAGNHDVWVGGRAELEAGKDSGWRYRTAIPKICEACEFVDLSRGPTLVGGVGFAATMGWYDYSYRVRKLDSVFSREDYARKVHDGKMWMDRRFAYFRNGKGRYSDERLAEAMIREFEGHLRQVRDANPRTVVAVTHFPAFDRLMTRRLDPDWSFWRAYMGCLGLGETIAKFPEVSVAIAGHYHKRIDKEIDAGGRPVRALISPVGNPKDWAHTTLERHVRDRVRVVEV
ncbi:MAG: metallophosphoesterase [Candidatus Methylomirabilis sp.]|nr:metallophosphoesterase [Deltaproteobacteria bacterium]